MDRLTLPPATTAPSGLRLRGAFLATAWNVAAPLPVSVLAIRLGWPCLRPLDGPGAEGAP